MRLRSRWLVLGCLVAFGCDERDAAWEAEVAGAPEAFGLEAGVAVIDAPADRVVLLPVSGDLAILPAALPIGRSFAAAALTPDAQRLAILSRGVVPRSAADDEGPSLTLVAASPEPRIVARYELSDPVSRLAMDPESRYAVAYPAADDGTFVHNPNELTVFDLERAQAADNPTELSLRSFGGRPERLSFTPQLHLPGGERRLLIVETDRDVSLIDLNHLDVPEITIPLTSGIDPLTPAAVAVSDGDAGNEEDARIAVRVEGDPNVVVVDLLPAPADTPQSFRAAPNVVFVGGVPTDIAFVMTDGGLRLAALVPSARALTLVDPATGIAAEVELEAPFDRMSLVTDIVGAGEDGSDVALLWSSQSPEVAFVALGSTVGKPYRSIESMQLSEPVLEVRDMPEPRSHLKILYTASGRSLFVLDVRERTAAPIESSESATHVTTTRSGDHVWVSAGGPEIARLELDSLHPLNLVLHRDASRLFEVARGDGGTALVALHADGALGATVLDAKNPSLAQAREHFGLLLGDLP